MPKAKNFQAILDWCKVNRPDLLPSMELIENNQALLLIATTAFEAGRIFQKENPNMPDGPGSHYLD